MYALLARIWLRELDLPLLNQLRSPELNSSFQSAGGELPPESGLDDLAVEYCRLFVGPKDHLPPLQSVWERGELQSDITSSIRSFADAANYQPPASVASLLHDHLGVQLDIMSHITLLLPSTAAEEEPFSFAAEFFRRHLTWPSDLLNTAIQRTTSPFYTTVVQMTATFLQQESSYWLDHSWRSAR